MKEKTVRQIMIKYFASKHIKVIPSRGAGPDLLIDGKAVEVKGSKYDFDRMLKQLVDYAYKYSDIALALPVDGLTLKRAFQLASLHKMIKEARDIRLKAYMIASDPSDKNVFYVREVLDASDIWAYMSPSELGFSLNNPDSTIGQAVENLINYSPVEKLRRVVYMQYTHKTSKVRI